MKSRAFALLALVAAVGCQSGNGSQAPGPTPTPTPTVAPPPAPAPPPVRAPTAAEAREVIPPKPATAPATAPTPAEDDALYATDIGSLCNVMELSGAKDYPEGQQIVPMAQWLGANIKTAAAKAFMIRVQALSGLEHADALDAEARRVGLDHCALSAQWRT